jgi:hypothetical protein
MVCLFGAVAAELGFMVEAFGHGYPDCFAKRRVIEGSGELRWDPCRIEFEFRSKNFLTHGHDPEKTDLVVCWVHDWEKPTVEVLELRLVVEGIRVLEKRERSWEPWKCFHRPGRVKSRVWRKKAAT